MHPGGRIHIEESLGEDISRCITGTVAINNNFKPYDHSFSARVALVNLAFAELIEDHKLVVVEDKR